MDALLWLRWALGHRRCPQGTALSLGAPAWTTDLQALLNSCTHQVSVHLSGLRPVTCMNFQEAGLLINEVVKVYSLKVDDLHCRTLFFCELVTCRRRRDPREEVEEEVEQVEEEVEEEEVEGRERVSRRRADRALVKFEAVEDLQTSSHIDLEPVHGRVVVNVHPYPYCERRGDQG
ncbi:uncharacterized protein LOC144954590 [Lampetra fluviatilis]